MAEIVLDHVTKKFTAAPLSMTYPYLLLRALYPG